jgi:SAM-dependent methyltransferase
VSYGAAFFEHVDATADGSARRVLPLVVDLLEPRSVVDVGCGLGTWLAEVARLGVDDYLGIDGYAPAESLQIPEERFQRHDLARPLRLDRRFDLVISLEVAEHLAPEAADGFVESLARLGPAILFSAAVPQQSGTDHLNEQWPDYWAERFEARGLVPVDVVRPRIWRDEEVSWWYRQNALLFCTSELLDDRPALRVAREATRDDQLAVVHPILYTWMCVQRDRIAAEAARPPSMREVADMVPGAAARAVRRRVGRRGDGDD